MVHPPDREGAVFNVARRLPAGQRSAYLHEACGSDAVLRQRVEELLQADEQASGFLESPAPGAGVLTMAASLPGPGGTLRVTAIPSEKAGDRIGRYKLLQQIGEGGCGVVYMAEQEEPVRRQVALKVIKLGMDTKNVIARFEAERQALALMDHPNIAKVLDAGATDTGRPYFVMELVRGIRITDYCDQSNLPTRERLDLFIQVCQAIQHAHQKGIIHRDIKPSNILVTLRDGMPVPKVIDFGIAKATTDQRLTDKTLFTAFAQFIGTPAYMSPEQAEMSELGIDTRSDIYSLGVLLYELLTGQTPFDAQALLRSGLDEIRRIIREEEPARPSTRLSTMADADLTEVAKHRQMESAKMIGLVRGELDWIVMKSLEKDRSRRYETANGLAMDVRRYLTDEPVVARPSGNLYRFQKLVLRNKLAFAAASVVMAALIIGLGVSTLMFFKEQQARQQAEAERKMAETEASKSQQVIQVLNNMLNDAGQSVAQGRERTLPREILDQTAEHIVKDLTNQPNVEASLLNNIGGIYRLLGEYEKAEAMYRQALAMRRKLLGDENLDVAQSLASLGYILWNRGKLAEAETSSREALAMRRKLLGNENLNVARSLVNLGLVVRDQGKRPEAEMLFRQSVAIHRKLLGDENLLVAWSLANLAVVLRDEGKFAEAEPMCRQVLAMRRKLLGDEHRDVALALADLACELQLQGKLAEAETLDREALAMLRKLLGNESLDLAWPLANLAAVLQWQGRLAEAETSGREALAIRRKLLGEENLDVAWSFVYLAFVLRDEGKLAEAELSFRQVLAIRRKLLGDEHPDVAQALAGLASVLQCQGKLAEAETSGREALAMQRKLLGDENLDVARTLDYLGQVVRDQGRLAEAEPMFRQVLAIRRKLLGNENPDLVQALGELASVLQLQGKLAEAEPLDREALELWRKQAGLGNSRALNETAWLLATCALAELRDGVAAIGYAGKAVAATNRKEPNYLDTLAAAYAEAGQFTNAVSTEQEAIALFPPGTQRNDFTFRLERFKANSPYRDGDERTNTVPKP